MKKIKNYIVDFFSKGHKRTLLAKKNIAASFIIKGLMIAIGLFLVPLTINYLDPTKYGIWITLSSIVGWFGFFDIGLSHGLRNRLSETLAIGDYELAKTYVSTTYAILTIVVVLLLLLFFVVNPFLNWNTLLNVDSNTVEGSELKLLAFVVFTFFCLRFIFKLITTVLTANQQPAKASVFDLLGKTLALVLVIILTKTTEGSLLYLGLSISSMPVFVLFLSSIWFYNGKYKQYRPSIKYIDFSKCRNLMGLGFKFFIIQIAAVLLFQTNNIVISHLFGPEKVTPYNIAFTYFTLLYMVYTIILTPFWSAFTEAWTVNDMDWISKITKNLMMLFIGLLLLGIFMLMISNWVYSVWIGKNIDIPFSLSAFVMIWLVLKSLNSLYANFLNGVGKIKLQTYVGIFSAILNIPLAIYLGLMFGIEGVVLGNIIVAVLGTFIYPLQYYKIMNNTAHGIWNK